MHFDSSSDDSTITTAVTMSDDEPPFPLAQPATEEEQEANARAWSEHFAKMQDPVHVHGANYEPPSVVTVQKKKQVVPEEKKELPVELRGFKFEHKDKLTCAEEVDKNSSKHGEPCTVNLARYIIAWAGKPNEKKWDLLDLNSHQLRRLALNFGCSRVGSSSKFECRRQMALKVDSGIIYGNLDVPNATSTAHEKKVNTMMRVLNAVFSPSLVERFLKLNDNKGQKDFESAHGGSPYKEFWKDVSNMVNDTTYNEELSVVLESCEEEDERLNEMVQQGVLNLNDFTHQTH